MGIAALLGPFTGVCMHALFTAGAAGVAGGLTTAKISCTVAAMIVGGGYWRCNGKGGRFC